LLAKLCGASDTSASFDPLWLISNEYHEVGIDMHAVAKTALRQSIGAARGAVQTVVVNPAHNLVPAQDDFYLEAPSVIIKTAIAPHQTNWTLATQIPNTMFADQDSSLHDLLSFLVLWCTRLDAMQRPSMKMVLCFVKLLASGNLYSLPEFYKDRSWNSYQAAVADWHFLYILEALRLREQGSSPLDSALVQHPSGLAVPGLIMVLNRLLFSFFLSKWINVLLSFPGKFAGTCRSRGCVGS
jgi:hypothetical protein